MYKSYTDTLELFKKLNINKKTLSIAQKKFLDSKGYLVISSEEYMMKNLDKLNKIANKLICTEGDKGGWEGKEEHYKKGKNFEDGTNRLGNLIEKHKCFRDLILIPEILASAYEVIREDIKIAGFNLRNPLKGSGNQKLHIDWKPRIVRTEPFYGVVCFIYLNDSNSKNGSIRVIPGSHKKLGWPDEHIDIGAKHKDEIRLNIKAGTIVIANLNLWHAGADNTNGKPRKMAMLNIKRRDQPQLLNYKKYLSKKTKKLLNSKQKYLLAVRENDTDQEENSVGVGKFYRERYKKNWKTRR